MTSRARLVNRLNTQPEWESFLDESYNKAIAKHTGNKTSWLKTQFRRGNRKDTTVDIISRVGDSTGVIAGGIGLGVTIAGTAAVTLYVLPVATIGIGLAYWGYGKHKRKTINSEIRNWYYTNCDERGQIDVNTEINDPDKVMKWIGWFGDSGIENMGHIVPKLTNSMNIFTRQYNKLIKEYQTLIKKADGFSRQVGSSEKQQKNNKNTIDRDAEKLGTKVLGLGVDLRYIDYRMERYTMYPLMLQLTMNNYQIILRDQRPEQERIYQGVDKYNENYEKLIYDYIDLSKELKRQF